MSPKISVVVTTFRRARLLGRTLESIAAQTRQPDELIVSDDCSPDDTAHVVETWRKTFPGLVYIRNEKNLNMPGNLNKAVAAASGMYIANLHDGDTYAPTLLEKWESALDRHPSAGLVFCGLAGWPARTKQGGGILLFPIAPFTKGREFFERHLLPEIGCPVWGTVMARKSAYDALLPFDPEFGFLSDVDMWARMCLAYDIVYVDEPMIVLDHTPSAERRLGTYNWNWLEITRRIRIANIHRFYAGDERRRNTELRRYRRLFNRFLVARLLGRIRHGDRDGLRKGLALARRRGGPLAWLGEMTG
ncbi:MAG TPA: glycosyltransferase family A protein [Thermoanaerobaculia bacterium]|jgi:glycosyltransferase involved in cell wall biosynthesis